MLTGSTWVDRWFGGWDWWVSFGEVGGRAVILLRQAPLL
jgi:hypothetical protein